jgi:DNA-binding MarR family transcriptional regulator
MNYMNRDHQNYRAISADAAMLASLTRELAHCCINKEIELFNRFGLTSSEGVVLLQVAEAGTALPSSLACILGLARSRMTPLTANLVEKGFLDRRESTTDRRVRELTLTEQGQKVASAAHGRRLDFHCRLLESYPESERARLMNTLTTLRKTMDELRE